MCTVFIAFFSGEYGAFLCSTVVLRPPVGTSPDGGVKYLFNQFDMNG